MNVRDYVFGQAITLRSPLRANEVSDRINQAAKSRWWPFHVGEVVGQARSGGVALRYASSPFEYDGKPILIGRIEDRGNTSVLHLKYRATIGTSAFFALWYVILVALTAAFIFIGPDPAAASEDSWPAWLILALLFLVPVAMHLFGTRNADIELEELLMFLRETVQAN